MHLNIAHFNRKVSNALIGGSCSRLDQSRSVGRGNPRHNSYRVRIVGTHDVSEPAANAMERAFYDEPV